MVSFWPFGKGDDKSAESFERVLSQLSTKISTTSAQQEKFRLRQRKYKVLWSIYGVFVHILVIAVLTVVVGWDAWGWIEYVVVTGGFPFIYTIRQAIVAYFDYLITNRQEKLNTLYKQREEAIDRLKKATKYNSTQQLLEKYGGSPPSKKQQPSAGNDEKRKANGQGKPLTPQAGRTGFAPPPTANIPSRQPTRVPTQPNTPIAAQRPASGGSSPPPQQGDISLTGPNEEFAPNAFSASAARSPTQGAPPGFPLAERKWYDRILDVMLGEDESSSKNRIALICQNCRLVNGQAPPGARTLEEVGKWRCSACHSLNGVESEESKILRQISQEGASSPVSPVSPASPNDTRLDESRTEGNDRPAKGDSDDSDAASSD